MSSIRVFLALVILAVITLASFISVLQGYRSSIKEAEQLFDQQLLETAKLIANLHTYRTATNIDHTSHIAFQVWQHGTLTASSSNAPITAIGPLAPGFDYNNFNGYRWRTVGYYNANNQHWVMVAQRTDNRFALAEKVTLESIFPTLISLPVVGILIWIIISRGLKPLRVLANELSSKQPDDLSPLSIHNPKQELAQIVTSSNGLLERLETSLLREKQFASDAAHELRTPISTLKVQLFNASEELCEHSQSITNLTETAQRLEHIVEQILDLYKSSPDQFNTTFTSIDLASLIQETIAQLYDSFDRKHQLIEFCGEKEFVRGDQFALTTLLQNLLSNANKYTPDHGKIKVSVTDNGDTVILVIEDSGPGIAADQYDLIFERFYRVGGDRHQSGQPGCGLGLAIVKRIVELHGGTIKVSPSCFETGCAFTIYLTKDQSTINQCGKKR